MFFVFALIASAFVLWPNTKRPIDSAPAPIKDTDLALTEQGILAYRLLSKAEKDASARDVLVRLANRDDGVGYWARISLSTRLKQESRYSEAAQLLAQCIEMRGKYTEQRGLSSLRKEYALLLEQAGEARQAFAEWSRLLPAQDALSSVKRLAPDSVELGAALVSGKLNKEALDVITGISTPGARLVRARAYAGLNRSADSVKEYAAYFRETNSQDPKVRLEYALSLERAGNLQDALREFGALGPDGLYGKGRVLVAMNRKHEAAAAYQESPSSEARRRAGLLWQELGYRDRALEVYMSLAKTKTYAGQEVALRALSICDVTKDTKRAGEITQLLNPGTAWLRGISTTPTTNEETAMKPRPHKDVPSIVTAEALIAEFGGERGLEMAIAEVEVATVKASDDELIALGEWLRDAGQVRPGVRIGAEVFKRSPSKPVYRLLYPLAFKDHVNRYAKEHSIDPYLIMAVIREESAYEHDVVSWAGAVGLMQLMPGTARSVAQRLNMVLGPDSLTDPAQNIRMGTFYLRGLLDQFEANVPRAAAGYNAGPNSVTRWLQTPSARSDRYFVEAITFAETRGYVLRVVDSWRIYRWLYGGNGE